MILKFTDPKLWMAELHVYLKKNELHVYLKRKYENLKIVGICKQHERGHILHTNKKKNVNTYLCHILVLLSHRMLSSKIKWNKLYDGRDYKKCSLRLNPRFL